MGCRYYVGPVVSVKCFGEGSSAHLWYLLEVYQRSDSFISIMSQLSSLNRHATAVLTDVGTPKVTCIEKNIARWVQVDSRTELLAERTFPPTGLLQTCLFSVCRYSCRTYYLIQSIYYLLIRDYYLVLS